MSKHDTVITCSLCHNSGHNKGGCKKNPDRGKKKNAHLVKTIKKKESNRGTLITLVLQYLVI